MTLAACGGDDSAKKTTPTPEASTDLSAIKTYLLDHTQRLSRDVATLQDRRAAVPRPRRAARLRLREAARRAPAREVAQAHRRRQEDLRRRQPGLRGDGGRGRRRARARRLRRDHRRRRRRLRSRERRPVLDQDAGGRPSSSRATSTTWSRRALFGTEPKFAGQGRQARPRRRRQGRVRRGAARRATSTSPPRATSRSSAKELDAAAKQVEPDRAGRVHRARRDDADDVGVLRGVEELALRRRRQGDREGVRRRLAPAGHRRHPRRPRADLRQRPAADREGRPPSRPPDRPVAAASCSSFAARLRDQEAGGKKFTAEDADTLGREAQDQAEAIAGQVTQAAGQLDIELEDASAAPLALGSSPGRGARRRSSRAAPARADATPWRRRGARPATRCSTPRRS